MTWARGIPMFDLRRQIRAFTLVDADVYDALSEYSWHLASNGYARRILRGTASACSYMHREIMALPNEGISGRQVDHINRDRLDNRRANLRVVTPAEQAQNKDFRAGTSQYRGVRLRRDTGKWVAQIKLDGRNRNLGSFDTEDEAARVAAAARAEHFPFADSGHAPECGIHHR